MKPAKTRAAFVVALLISLVAFFNTFDVEAQTTGGSTIIALRASDGTFISIGRPGTNAINAYIVGSDVSSGGTASTFGAAFPSTGTASGFSDGTNMQGARVFDLDTGGGTQYGLGVNLRRTASGGSSELQGQTTAALSLPVVLATDQIGMSAANNDGAQVSMTTTSSTVLASFSTRKFASICSLATNSDTVYIKMGATATTSDFPLLVGQCFNMPPFAVYTGIIDGRSASGTQTLGVVEW